MNNESIDRQKEAFVDRLLNAILYELPIKCGMNSEEFLPAAWDLYENILKILMPSKEATRLIKDIEICLNKFYSTGSNNDYNIMFEIAYKNKKQLQSSMNEKEINEIMEEIKKTIERDDVYKGVIIGSVIGGFDELIEELFPKSNYPNFRRMLYDKIK